MSRALKVRDGTGVVALICNTMAFERKRQENPEWKAILSYTASLICLKQKRKKNN